MFSILMTIEIFVSILLVVVILMQASKGGGLAGTFGGANVGMVFGVRRTADFLMKSTQVLGIAFGALALIINMFFLPRAYEGGVESIFQSGTTTEQAPVTPQLPPSQEAPLPAPSQSGPQTPPNQTPGPGGQQ